MKLKFISICLVILTFGITGLFARIEAQNGENFENEPAALKKLRELYFKRDFETGTLLGEKAAAKFPANTELQAWYLLNLASGGIFEQNASGMMFNPQASQAVELAKNLQRRYPSDAWANFALGQANIAAQDFVNAAAPIDRALEIDPKNEEFILARANYLSGLRRYDEMNSWLDKNSGKLTRARILNFKLLALLRSSKQYPNRQEKLTELFAQIFKIAPDNVYANYLYGFWLNRDGKFGQAIPVWKKAISLSPTNLQNHQEYWTAISGQTDKTETQKNAELAENVENLLVADKNSASALMIVARKYEELNNNSKRDFYENMVLEKYPNTKYDEAVLFNRIKRAGRVAEVSTAINDNKFRALNEMSWQFIRRPAHFDEDKLGMVYVDALRRLGKTTDATDAQLSELISGALQYNKSNLATINLEIAEILVNGNKLRPASKLNKDAEKYARDAITETENLVENLQPNLPEAMKKIRRGRALDMLGYILMQEGQIDEAEQQLLKAEQLLDAKSNNAEMMNLSVTTNKHLAQLYAAKKEYDKAEKYYLMNTVDNDATKKIFADLYKQQTGKTDNFDDYYNAIRQKIKVSTRERILASKIENPKDAVPFSLKTIDNKTISFADLKGKVVVINVWGTWCAPCVGEMPQVQELYKKYENDNDVAIITMDSDDELENLKRFITEKKYDFPVLIGDSYVGHIRFDGNIAFPTTLFIDKQGRVAFVKVGDSENLVEEFGWRIEALKTN